MNSVTVSVDQLIDLAASGYIYLHVLFGLVTHYHSVWQVRKYNMQGCGQISPATMCVFFIGRLTAGLPWFVVRKVITPIGSQWHMIPEQISRSMWG